MMTVCGSTHTECGGKEVEADKSDLHAVRCCRDTEAPGWKKRQDCDVWATSHLGEDRTCYPTVTYETAEVICASTGARLCTASELLRDCLTNTGCGHNRRMVWSSSYPFPLYGRTLATDFVASVPTTVDTFGIVKGNNTVYNIDHEEWITYGNVFFGPSGTTSKIRVWYGKGCCEGYVEIRLGNQYGDIIGTFQPQDTGDWDNFEEVDIDIADVEGLHHITFVGKDSFGIMNFESFELMQ